MRQRKHPLIVLVLMILLIDSPAFAFWGNDTKIETEVEKKRTKNITLNDDGLVFQINSKAKTVAGFIEEQGISIKEADTVVPARKSNIYSGSRVTIQRAKQITVVVDGKEIRKHTYFDKTEDALLEAEIFLSPADIVRPHKNSLVYNEMEINITRVNLEKKIVKEDIDFKTVFKEDDELGWREKKIEQKGENGIREIKYEITYHNGKEISRKVLENTVIKKPTNEIVTQGSYVKIGKAHTGFGTWYVHTGTMAAASPWLPMGSYAKVTNKTNGKSVIVKINDRGPFGKNRIIDLDKVAFRKIASLGAGVIDVKVEEILN